MPAEKMNAIQQHEFGGPAVLLYEKASMPEVKLGEVLVRVHAIGITRQTGISGTATRR